MADKDLNAGEVRQELAKSLRRVIDEHAEELKKLRERELSKAEDCEPKDTEKNEVMGYPSPLMTKAMDPVAIARMAANKTKAKANANKFSPPPAGVKETDSPIGKVITGSSSVAGGAPVGSPPKSPKVQTMVERVASRMPAKKSELEKATSPVVIARMAANKAKAKANAKAKFTGPPADVKEKAPAESKPAQAEVQKGEKEHQGVLPEDKKSKVIKAPGSGGKVEKGKLAKLEPDAKKPPPPPAAAFKKPPATVRGDGGKVSTEGAPLAGSKIPPLQPGAKKVKLPGMTKAVSASYGARPGTSEPPKAVKSDFDPSKPLDGNAFATKRTTGKLPPSQVKGVNAASASAGKVFDAALAAAGSKKKL